MKMEYLTPDEFRQILNEELDKRFGPVGSSRSIPPTSARTEDDELVGTAEAARILGCSTRTIAAHRSRRLYSVVFLGPHKAMYYRSELEAFRTAHTRPNRDSK